MKTIRFIFVAATMSIATFAADITLNDGRVFKDAFVTSQTPRKVTIKHANGLSSVGKELLSTELQAKYPINEAAARAADEKASIAREAALNARKAETERLARVRTEREATAIAYEADQVKEAAQNASQSATATADARKLAERYFEKDYSGLPSGSRSANVTINEIRPVDGVSGRWFVTGRAVIRISSSTTRGYSTYRQGGDTGDQWRDQYNNNQRIQENRNRYDNERREHASDKTQTCPDPSPNRDNKQGNSSDERHRHESYRQETPNQFPSYSDNSYATRDATTDQIETRDFEAYYSSENGAPSINVTVR